MAEPTNPLCPATYILDDLSNIVIRLFNNTFLKVLSEICAHLSRSAFGRNLGDIMLNHQLHQLFEGCLGGIPAQLSLGLGRITPKVDNIGRAVEVFADANQRLSDKRFGTLDADADLIDALAFELQFDASMTERQISKLAD